MNKTTVNDKLSDYYPLDWHDIFVIDRIGFDIKIQYEYVKIF